MDFSQKLVALREERRQNQTASAIGIGTTQRKVSYWETGATEPCLEDLKRICQYYQVSADYLIGLTDDPQPYPLPQRNQ